MGKSLLASKSGTYLKAGEFIPGEKVAFKTVAVSCYKELVDGSGGCLFAMVMGVNHWKLFEWLNTATGWQKTPDEFMVIGKRVQTLRQMFGIKHGIDPVSFKMSSHMAGESPLEAGPNRGKTVPIKEMMQEHWKAYGWDAQTGMPTKATLSELGMENLVLGQKYYY